MCQSNQLRWEAQASQIKTFFLCNRNILKQSSSWKLFHKAIVINHRVIEMPPIAKSSINKTAQLVRKAKPMEMKCLLPT